MSIVGDALKDTFKKKDKPKSNVNKQIEELNRLKSLQADLEAEISKGTPAEKMKAEMKQEIKPQFVSEQMPEPPQYEEPIEEKEDATSDKEITIEDVLSDFETRLHRIEKIIEFMIYRR